jgi:hypothetical protein
MLVETEMFVIAPQPIEGKPFLVTGAMAASTPPSAAKSPQRAL